MTRPLIAAAVLLASSALFATAASAATQAAKPAAKSTAKKAPQKEAEPTEAPDDNLTAGQLTMADRVLTGVASCEFNQTVKITPLPGHTGNFTLTFDKHSYIVQPKETTTGAILLRDHDDTIIWVQIPKKSMLMNQKLHQRLVDNCQQDEQRIASESAAQAGANAAVLAPSVATPASAAAATRGSMATAATVAPGAKTAPTHTTPAKAPAKTSSSKATTKVEPPAPVQHAEAPDAAASGMFK